MISYQTGNIFESDAEALVNAVNCVGVMGKGLALQFKKYFPQNYKDYSKACENNEVKPGQMLIFESESKLIINFPTKRHWRSKSRLEDIESGLVSLSSDIRRRDVKSIALPALGAGLGGLDWDSVKALIENILGELKEVNILVFEPR